ncbi:DUF3601 domain-containing protein [Hymenobacter sp. RP-2-7]|uniref:DUF3601 domain-containing protein n=1 Tax=Hymenobacter polaris TaxID=2682546 RepID=A0A7Y0ACB6_9BACT|nr:DUF3601 domain-containing protein [Hymenobacter polaris]NML64744.1 DUF3601 domain-containing protein [Hymenobacter polaris]
MADIRALRAGCRYRVVRAFTDYDQRLHPVGETWEFIETHFLPYEDGLTLHVLLPNLPAVFRLQWRPEAQAAILNHFTTYVEAC